MAKEVIKINSVEVEQANEIEDLKKRIEELEKLVAKLAEDKEQ